MSEPLRVAVLLSGEGTSLENLFETISFGPARPFDPLGTIIGTWDDSGLNLETFWLGWAAGLSYGWHPGTPAPEEAVCRCSSGLER